MALLSIFRGTQAECSARPVSDGTLLFATDTKKIYLDKDSSRIEMSSVDDLSNYVTKEQLTTALNGKANTTHTHTQDQITGLKDTLAGKASTSHSHSVASSSTSGFMSATDKQKLDGIAAGANKYTLPVASSTALGGMKIGYKESGKNYSVKLDNNNQAYVTVPWTDTTSKDTNTTYILTKSGSTITLEGSDGSSTAVNDDNTTYSLGSFGITATAAELNYVDGVTSNVQTQLNKKQDKMKTVTIPSSGNTNKNKWVKFATVDMSSAPAWTACSGTLSFCNNNPYSNPAPRGFLNFSLTTGDTAGTITGDSFVWVSLSSNSYATSVADVKVSNGKYDIYYKPIMDYETAVVSLIDCTYTNYFTFNIGSWVDSIAATTISKVNSYADSAGSVPWGGVSGKPATYPPSSHTHDDRYYTESEVDSKLSGKANSSHTHTKSQITDFPSSLKNPNSLMISLNGTSQGAYDGSAAKSINVTPASIGAAASSHNHDASNITSGTLSADRIPTITDGKIQSVSASKITGTIPQSILPSYVDDVLEYTNLAAFPKTGESGKIYVADDTNKTYRWSGTAYVEISASLALGTTSSTAFRGDYGNTAYAHAQAKGSAFSSGLYKITTNSQGHVTAATAVTKSDITALGIPGSDTNTNTTYSLSKSGSTITLKGSDGSTTSVTDADTNTTYSTFKGATTSAAGGTGLVPAPATGAANRYLRSDGTWQVPPDNNTTYPNMGGASSSAAGYSGLVPAPAAGASNRYLRSDGTWSVPPDNNTNTTYSLSKSGSTITLTGSDGSKTSVTDSNTTYSLSSFGVTATAAELNYVDGVTSNVQTQLNNKADVGHTHLYAGSSSVGGPANSATKLATGRTIGVGTAVTSIPKSFNGESNITIPIDSVKESYLDWGGKGLAGNVSPIGMSLSDEHSANRLAFINGNALTMEYSSDGGSTYKDYGYSAADKSAFCTLSKDVPIGRTSGAYTTSSRTRITLFAQPYVYTDPKKMLINVSSSGGMNVLIEYKTGANGAMWKTYGYFALSGWSSWNDIPLVLGTLGGGSSQTNNIWYLRMTFIMTSVSSSANTTASVLGIRLFGTNSWNSASLINQKGVMSSTGHLYSYDINANAVFPADVRAATFTGSLNGNATTATTASSATQLSTSAGSATQPVYFSNGKPAAIAYTIGKSVPSNAVFTDTTYSLSKNGSTITLTGSDGSKTSVTDNNTTYSLSSFGINASATELNYVKGVTSSIQTQLNGKLSTSGTAAAATKLATARTIALSGDVTGSANFDGSANISITSNIAAGTVGSNELASNAVTNAKIAADSVSLEKLGSDVGTVAVQSSEPSDTNVKLWIQI